MKYILVLILLLPSYLLGLENSKPQNLQREYSHAIELYKSKNYQESYEILSKLYLTKLSDAKVNPLYHPTQVLMVEEIPKLGSGKTDFGATKKIALVNEQKNISA